jgi:hypothetical protein
MKLIQQFRKTFAQSTYYSQQQQCYLNVLKSFIRSGIFPSLLVVSRESTHTLNVPPVLDHCSSYKQYHSMALQGVADVKYKCICTVVSTYGKQSGGGIFLKCTLFQHLGKKTCSPPEKCLPGTELKPQDVLMGDKAYPLKECLIRPYSKVELNAEVWGTQNC